MTQILIYCLDFCWIMEFLHYLLKFSVTCYLFIFIYLFIYLFIYYLLFSLQTLFSDQVQELLEVTERFLSLLQHRLFFLLLCLYY